MVPVRGIFIDLIIGMIIPMITDTVPARIPRKSNLELIKKLKELVPRLFIIYRISLTKRIPPPILRGMDRSSRYKTSHRRSSLSCLLLAPMDLNRAIFLLLLFICVR